MKHIWLTAALLLGAWTAVFAQPSNNQTYSIHLGSFVQLSSDDFQDVRQLGYLYTESFNEHLKQLFLGEYKTKPLAEAILVAVHKKGFPDAYIIERKLEGDQKVEVVQVGVELLGEQIPWKKYKGATPISTIIDKKYIRIVAGPFPSHEATVHKVEQLKKAGYGNAFIRTEYSLRLHPVTDFEAPDLFLPDNPEPSNLAIINEMVKKTPVPPVKKVDKTALDVEAKLAVAKSAPKKEIIPPAVNKIPEDYEPEFIAKAIPETGLSMPNIRPELKRTSALELQKVLKQSKFYSGSLDGYYGQGTSDAFADYTSNSDDWKKYSLISKYLSPKKVNLKYSDLIEGIDLVIGTPTKAKNALAKNDHPLAKAYQAYILRELSDENILEVNRLMNEANKQSFADYSGDLPFDFTASYSYNDKDQLLKHLAFLHGVNEEVPVPCWLFQKHQYDAISAFESVENYTMESCDPFMDWEVLRNLETIVQDVNTKSDEKRVDASSRRSKLFLNPPSYSYEEMQAIYKWNTEYWEKMDQWAKEDPLHEKIITSMKVAYYQSQVLIEDYYINSGMEYRQSKALGLTTLKTIVGE